jgi:cytoskeletal protein CcmA (bactofilin family)
MWKKEDVKSQPVAENSTAPGISTTPALSSPRDAAFAAPPASRSSSGSAIISHGIRIKGEVTGSEDLILDGHFEGKLNLTNGKLTVGPNGEIKADLYAREIIVLGKVDGKIVGRERIQLGSTGNVAGDLQTERLAIEDGAILRGKIEIETGKPIQMHSEARSATAGASTKSSSSSAGSGSAAD